MRIWESRILHFYFLLYLGEESFGLVKMFEVRFFPSLIVLRCPGHVLATFKKMFVWLYEASPEVEKYVSLVLIRKIKVKQC